MGRATGDPRADRDRASTAAAKAAARKAARQARALAREEARAAAYATFPRGTEVTHPVYGPGVITATEDCAFDACAIARFMQNGRTVLRTVSWTELAAVPAPPRSGRERDEGQQRRSRHALPGVWQR